MIAKWRGSKCKDLHTAVTRPTSALPASASAGMLSRQQSPRRPEGWSSLPSRQHGALGGGEADVPRGLCVLHQDFHPTARFGMDLQALKKQQH